MNVQGKRDAKSLKTGALGMRGRRLCLSARTHTCKYVFECVFMCLCVFEGQPAASFPGHCLHAHLQCALRHRFPVRT